MEEPHECITNRMAKRNETQPTLDWHKAPLVSGTRIDAAYKNTQNVRRFLKKRSVSTLILQESSCITLKPIQG